MKILGIDPGLNTTGYGLVNAAGLEDIKLIEAGTITTDIKAGISIRVADIYTNVVAIIKEHDPEVLVLEKLYAHYKHPATAILMGHARGVICLACGLNDVKLVSYSATRIKKAVTGSGRASKQQVQLTVKGLLRLSKVPEPVDITDALAMAISFVFMGGIDGPEIV